MPVGGDESDAWQRRTGSRSVGPGPGGPAARSRRERSSRDRRSALGIDRVGGMPRVLSELGRKKLRELKAIAREQGASEEDIEGVDDEDDPKSAAIQLIQRMQLPNDRREQLADRTLRELKDMARQLGAGDGDIDDLDDAVDAKEAAVVMVLSLEEQASDAGGTYSRDQLDKWKRGALQTECKKHGLPGTGNCGELIERLLSSHGAGAAASSSPAAASSRGPAQSSFGRGSREAARPPVSSQLDGSPAKRRRTPQARARSGGSSGSDERDGAAAAGNPARSPARGITIKVRAYYNYADACEAAYGKHGVELRPYRSRRFEADGSVKDILSDPRFNKRTACFFPLRKQGTGLQHDRHHQRVPDGSLSGQGIQDGDLLETSSNPEWCAFVFKLAREAEEENRSPGVELLDLIKRLQGGGTQADFPEHHFDSVEELIRWHRQKNGGRSLDSGIETKLRSEWEEYREKDEPRERDPVGSYILRRLCPAGPVGSSTPTWEEQPNASPRTNRFVPQVDAAAFAALAALYAAKDDPYLRESKLRTEAQELCCSDLTSAPPGANGNSAWNGVLKLTNTRLRNLVRVEPPHEGDSEQRFSLLHETGLSANLARRCYEFSQLRHRIVDGPILREAGVREQWDIVLLIDSEEKDDFRQRLEARCEAQGIKTLVRQLPVGDYMWVYIERYQQIEDRPDGEMGRVLPFVVERKAFPFDLHDSLRQTRSGRRLVKQMDKMRASGLKNKILLLEGDQEKIGKLPNKGWHENHSAYAANLKDVEWATLRHGFQLQWCVHNNDTADWLILMTRLLTERYKNSISAEELRTTIAEQPLYSDLVGHSWSDEGWINERLTTLDCTAVGVSARPYLTMGDIATGLQETRRRDTHSVAGGVLPLKYVLNSYPDEKGDLDRSSANKGKERSYRQYRDNKCDTKTGVVTNCLQELFDGYESGERTLDEIEMILKRNPERYCSHKSLQTFQAREIAFERSFVRCVKNAAAADEMEQDIKRLREGVINPFGGSSQSSQPSPARSPQAARIPRVSIYQPLLKCDADSLQQAALERLASSTVDIVRINPSTEAFRLHFVVSHRDEAVKQPNATFRVINFVLMNMTGSIQATALYNNADHFASLLELGSSHEVNVASGCVEDRYPFITDKGLLDLDDPDLARFNTGFQIDLRKSQFKPINADAPAPVVLSDTNDLAAHGVTHSVADLNLGLNGKPWSIYGTIQYDVMNSSCSWRNIKLKGACGTELALRIQNPLTFDRNPKENLQGTQAWVYAGAGPAAIKEETFWTGIQFKVDLLQHNVRLRSTQLPGDARQDAPGSPAAASSPAVDSSFEDSDLPGSEEYNCVTHSLGQIDGNMNGSAWSICGKIVKLEGPTDLAGGIRRLNIHLKDNSGVIIAQVWNHHIELTSGAQEGGLLFIYVDDSPIKHIVTGHPTVYDWRLQSLHMEHVEIRYTPRGHCKWFTDVVPVESVGNGAQDEWSIDVRVREQRDGSMQHGNRWARFKMCDCNDRDSAIELFCPGKSQVAEMLADRRLKPGSHLRLSAGNHQLQPARERYSTHKFQIQSKVDGAKALDWCVDCANAGRAHLISVGQQGRSGAPTQSTRRSRSIRNIEISVIGMDIVEVKTDAVVNPANARSFTPQDGGASKVLRDACSDVGHDGNFSDVCGKPKTWCDDTGELQTGQDLPEAQACLQETGGRLKKQGVKFVIHAHGPSWYQFTADECTDPAGQHCQDILNKIKMAVDRSLQIAVSRKLQSITVPCISGGLFTHSTPPDLQEREQAASREAVVAACMTWAQKAAAATTLRRIVLVDHPDLNVGRLDLLEAAFDRSAAQVSPPRSPSIKSAQQKSTPTRPRQRSTSTPRGSVGGRPEKLQSMTGSKVKKDVVEALVAAVSCLPGGGTRIQDIEIGTAEPLKLHVVVSHRNAEVSSVDGTDHINFVLMHLHGSIQATAFREAAHRWAERLQLGKSYVLTIAPEAVRSMKQTDSALYFHKQVLQNGSSCSFGEFRNDIQIALATSSKPIVDPNSFTDVVADRDLVTYRSLDGDGNDGSIQDASLGRATPKRALFPDTDDEDSHVGSSLKPGIPALPPLSQQVATDSVTATPRLSPTRGRDADSDPNPRAGRRPRRQTTGSARDWSSLGAAASGAAASEAIELVSSSDDEQA